MEKSNLIQIIVGITGITIGIVLAFMGYYFVDILIAIAIITTILILRRNYKATKNFIRVSLIVIMVLLPILMIWGLASFGITNIGRTEFIGNPEIAFDNSTYSVNLSLPVSIENPTVFPIEETLITFSMSNGTEKYDLGLFRIPRILPETILNYTVSYSISFENITAIEEFSKFMQSVSIIEFRMNAGFMLSSLYVSGRIENITAIIGGF